MRRASQGGMLTLVEIQRSAAPEKLGTKITVGGKERVMPPFEAGMQKYGKEEYELMVRLLGFVENGRKDALRAQYVEILGLARMSGTEQERKLYENKAYQKALAEADLAKDREKRLLRDIFERMSNARAIIERFKVRRDRINRMRLAIRARLEEKAKDYETKKRMYDARFEQIESTAYKTGADRIEEDRTRYEAMSLELEEKIRQENSSISLVQKAGEDVERVREQLTQASATTRSVLHQLMETVQVMLSKLDTAVPAKKDTEILAKFAEPRAAAKPEAAAPPPIPVTLPPPPPLPLPPIETSAADALTIEPLPAQESAHFRPIPTPPPAPESARKAPPAT